MSDNYTAWGLVAGNDAFYAESLGYLYLFLAEGILKHLKDDSIEEALILNFHVGLRCSGEFKIKSVAGSDEKIRIPFDISLSNPSGTLVANSSDFRPSLISMIAERLGGRSLKLGVCSAAVVTEAYRDVARNSGKMAKFMCLDYSPGYCLSGPQFEKSVMRRLQELAAQNIEPHLFHSASDLPLTVLYLKFSKPILPLAPYANVEPDHDASKITEILATGIYEPRNPTDVLQEGGDIEIPTQILVARGHQGNSKISRQITSLRKMYEAHLTRSSVPLAGVGMDVSAPHKTRIFFVHQNRPRDCKVAERIKDLIAGHSANHDLEVQVVGGLDEDTWQHGQTFYAKLQEWVQACDYAIVLLPVNGGRYNVPYELGLFQQRYIGNYKKPSARAILIANSESIPDKFSDYSGVFVISREQEVESWDAEGSELFAKLASHIPFLEA
ncbi:hypothetical protein [Endothiovibrio diazotrophicus]